MYEEFRRDDRGGEESGRGIEQPDAGLFPDIREVPEVPGHEVIDLVERSEGDVEGVGDELAVKDPARDVTFRKNGDLFGKLKPFKRLQYFQIPGTVWFFEAFELALDED